MHLIELPARPDNWDSCIQPFYTKTLFHESAWLDHVLTIHPSSRIDYFVLVSGETTCGYVCALKLRKWLIPIYGSPLMGTGTNYMGPVVDTDVEQEEVVGAIVEMCKRKGIGHLELSNSWLCERVMMQQGFDIHRSVTHVCHLPESEADAWTQLKSTCRNRMRQGERNGLVVETTEDPSLAGEYHAQLTEVYAKQGRVPPFGVDRVRSLLQHLLPADRIFPVWVKYNDTVIASGLFPHDERCVYFWGAASWVKYQHLCPNEVMHWYVMKLAIARKIPLYNMCGGTSQFKNKFGGDDIAYNHYSRSAVPMLRYARRVYRASHFWGLRMKGLLRMSDVPRNRRVG